ncbi:MAG: hypothetical protein ABR507_11135 [Actinomycetota bacterium]
MGYVLPQLSQTKLSAIVSAPSNVEPIPKTLSSNRYLSERRKRVPVHNLMQGPANSRWHLTDGRSTCIADMERQELKYDPTNIFRVNDNIQTV